MTEKFTFKQWLVVIGFFIAVFVIGLDSFIISPLLSTISIELHSSVAQIGFGITMYAVFYAVGAPIIAPFLEQLPRKQMILIGLTLFMVATGLCGTVTSVYEFWAYRALAGLGAAMFTPNVYAYIGSQFHPTLVGKTMGIVMSALSLSIAIGVPAGSFIAGWLGWRWTFLGSATFALISVTLISVLVSKDTQTIRHISKPFSQYLNILTHRNAWLGLLNMLLWMYGFYAMYTYLGTYVETNFHLSVGITGMVFVAYGVSNFISTFTGGWIGSALGMKRAVTIAGVISVLAYLALGYAPGLISFIIALAVLALAQGVAPQLTTYNATVLPESRATMTSLNSSFLYLGLTLGSAIGGALYQNISFVAVCISAVIATSLGIVIGRVIMTN